MIDVFAETFLYENDIRLHGALKSFYSIGSKWSYWSSNFGKHLFRVGFSDPKNFLNLKEKVETILNIANSLGSLIEISLDTDDVWCSIVGLDDSTISHLLLLPNAKDLIKLFFPIYKKLIYQRIGSLKCFAKLIYLLNRDVSYEIRMRSLSLVVNFLKDQDLSDYSHERYISLYSEYLAKIWEYNQSELKLTREYSEYFQKLLTLLVAIQDPNALVLATYFSEKNE
jgi:hypothetical protein